jgi:hypothetical protein
LLSGISVNQQQQHDYSEIMGYKNIDISRDVDQSYMLKGGSTNRQSTGVAKAPIGSTDMSYTG